MKAAAIGIIMLQARRHQGRRIAGSFGGETRMSVEQHRRVVPPRQRLGYRAAGDPTAKDGDPAGR